MAGQIKSDDTDLVLNAGGSGSDIKFQSNGSEVASISDGGVVTATSYAGSGANLTGISSVGGATGVDFNDNVKARFGTGNDLEIYHDGSNSYIADVGTGDLTIRAGNDLRLQDPSTKAFITCNQDDSVQLYYDNNLRVETTNAGVTVTGTLTGNLTGAGVLAAFNNDSISGITTSTDWMDNARLRLGNSNDLQIYHDGTDSYIHDSGSGNLELRTNGAQIGIMAINGSEYMGKFVQGNQVELYHNNAKKFETTSTGIDVTGDAKATNLAIPNCVAQKVYKHITPSGAVTNAGALSELNTDLRITFTPKHASSKIVHEFHAPYNIGNSTHLQFATFFNNTANTNVIGSASAGSRTPVHWAMRTSDTDANDYNSCSMMAVESASSTSARTYTIRFGTEGVTATFGVSPLSSSSGCTWPMVYVITEIYNPS